MTQDSCHGIHRIYLDGHLSSYELSITGLELENLTRLETEPVTHRLRNRDLPLFRDSTP